MTIKEIGGLGQEKVMKTEGEVFIINIRANQNKTWQGTVCWARENETVAFRSTLELFKLMDAAINLSRLEISA